MISLVNKIPKLSLPLAEVVKINCNYASYSDVALFWVQDDGQAVISMLDGNMVIYNRNANLDEIKEFIGVISPSSIFSDSDTLTRLFKSDFHKVNVMKCENAFASNVVSDTLSSNKVYDLLNVEGLELPPYEYFAVDFCHRLNRGQLKYFALKENCAAIGISDGQAVLVNGIASHQKGMGTIALNGLLAQYNVTALVVCEDHVVPFYLKNLALQLPLTGYKALPQ